MKITKYFIIAATVLTMVACTSEKSDNNSEAATSKVAEAPKMKMTTDIPQGLLTPNHIDSRIGELNMVDGVPTVETAQLIYDNLDFQHGVTSFLSGIQIASMEAMRKGIL